MYHPFSVAETIKTSWDILKKNFAVIAVYSLIGFFLVGVMAFVIYNMLTGNIMTSIGIIVLLFGVSFIFLGYIKLVFQLIDRQYYDFDFSDIVPQIKMLLSYVFLLIVISVIAVFLTTTIETLNEGFTQKILGILIGGFFQFFFLFYFPICTCFIVDDDSGPFESVMQSFHLIRGNFLKYFVLFLLIEALVIIGSLTIIGILIVWPFINLVLVVAYRKLVYSHKDVDDDIAETM